MPSPFQVDNLKMDRKDRKDRYHLAFERFVESEKAPSLVEIAKEFDLDCPTLTLYAERFKWAQRRLSIKSQVQMVQQDERLALAVRVDSQMLNLMASEIIKAGDCYRELLAKVRALPDEGRSDDAKRGKSAQTLLRTKVELLSDCIKGLAVLSTEARNLGLVVPLKQSKGEDGAGGLDLSKLQTLNVTLVQAQQAAGVRPDPVDVSTLPAVITLPSEPEEADALTL
jgi:hypothetical protein